MENIFHASTRVGDIVTKLPAASRILKAYRIDFCCGGNRPISDAVQEKNLNLQEILDQLNQLYTATEESNQDTTTSWEQASYTDIIDRITNKHHAYLKVELPELSMLVTKIFRVHGSNHEELAQVYRLFQNLKTEMELHMEKEEQDAFPLILDFEQEPTQSKHNNINRVIGALEAEHDVAGDLLRQIREVTNDYALPPDACRSYQLTFRKLEDLESDMFDHVHLENNILFPRILKEEANV